MKKGVPDRKTYGYNSVVQRVNGADAWMANRNGQ